MCAARAAENLDPLPARILEETVVIARQGQWSLRSTINVSARLSGNRTGERVKG